MVKRKCSEESTSAERDGAKALRRDRHVPIMNHAAIPTPSMPCSSSSTPSPQFDALTELRAPVEQTHHSVQAPFLRGYAHNATSASMAAPPHSAFIHSSVTLHHGYVGHGHNPHDQMQPHLSPEVVLEDVAFDQERSNEFLTPEEFERIMDEYIGGLSEKKRDKALIRQSYYDNILGVKKNPEEKSIEDSQFRHWSRTRFGIRTDPETGDEIVLLLQKPVAVRENLYEVITQGHTACSHGGRDKTAQQVRGKWSMVPKDLIARYVRNCPTCKEKRSRIGSRKAAARRGRDSSTVPLGPLSSAIPPIGEARAQPYPPTRAAIGPQQMTGMPDFVPQALSVPISSNVTAPAFTSATMDDVAAPRHHPFHFVHMGHQSCWTPLAVDSDAYYQTVLPTREQHTSNGLSVF